MGAIYLGNDHTVTLDSLVDSAGGPLVGATVSATLLHGTTLQEIPGHTWPLAMQHIADGTYTGTIDKAVSVNKGVEYVLRVKASQGEADAQWDLLLECEWRQ